VLREVVAENGDFRQVPLQTAGCLAVLKAQLGQANPQLILKQQNCLGLRSAHTEIQWGVAPLPCCLDAPWSGVATENDSRRVAAGNHQGGQKQNDSDDRQSG
jgi:hypothetical protein